jgi:hypothetical protein
VLADDLGWSVEAFREAFGEALREGLVDADWKVGVIVLRRALIDSHGDPRESSKPASPNVIRSWAMSWSDIPECGLKRSYLHTLGSFTEALGEAFHAAFQEAFRKALAQPSPHPSCNQDTGYRIQDTGSDCAPPARPEQGDLTARAASPARPGKRSRVERSVAMPGDWAPRSDELELARSLSVDPSKEAAAFRDHHSAKGSRFVDWNAAFRTWLRNAVRFGRAGGGAGARGGPSFFEVLDSLPPPPPPPEARS